MDAGDGDKIFGMFIDDIYGYILQSMSKIPIYFIWDVGMDAGDGDKIFGMFIDDIYGYLRHGL